jgi:predicted Zn-dependent protease
VTADAPKQSPSPEAKTEYGAFTEEQLYRAIVGELEANSGDIVAAGDSYLDLALSTKDLGVILRAVQFASIANDTNALLQLGLVWASVDPTDPQPQLLLAIEYLEAGAFDRAIPRMARVLELGGSIDFSALSSRTGQLNPQSRAQLIRALEPLLTQFPDDDSLALAQIQLLAQSGEYDAALTALDTARAQVTQTAGTVLLETQILQNMGRADDAARAMRAGVKVFDTDPVLRSTLARLLISQDQLAAALREYATLIEQFPQNWEARYAMAITHLELEQHGEAVEQLQALIDADQQVDESRYMMGVAFERDEQFERAIDNYRLVSIGTNNFLAAQQQATRLSIAQGNFDDAHDWLQRVSRGQPRLEILLITLEAQLLQQARRGRARQTAIRY